MILGWRNGKKTILNWDSHSDWAICILGILVVIHFIGIWWDFIRCYYIGRWQQGHCRGWQGKLLSGKLKSLQLETVSCFTVANASCNIVLSDRSIQLSSCTRSRALQCNSSLEIFSRSNHEMLMFFRFSNCERFTSTVHGILSGMPP